MLQPFSANCWSFHAFSKEFSPNFWAKSHLSSSKCVAKCCKSVSIINHHHVSSRSTGHDHCKTHGKNMKKPSPSASCASGPFPGHLDLEELLPNQMPLLGQGSVLGWQLKLPTLGMMEKTSAWESFIIGFTMVYHVMLRCKNTVDLMR